MFIKAQTRLSAFHIFEGLQEGLSHFSGPSRVALIYSVKPADPLRIYDPQNLLRGHEPRLKEIYLQSDSWRKKSEGMEEMTLMGQPVPVQNNPLTGLISYGCQSHSIYYQMWFTEHHPDMCSIGPTERWLEHAAWLLSNEMQRKSGFYAGTSGYVLREYGTHAVRDYLVDQLNLMIGMDNRVRIYPVLDAVLAISETMEEGAWPLGKILFAEQRFLKNIHFEARLPDGERPSIEKAKHVRKLLKAVESSRRLLISDGKLIVGIGSNNLPDSGIVADFRAGFGFLSLNRELICSFSDGRFHSTTRKAKLVELEEILLESNLEPWLQNRLFKIASQIVHFAEDMREGCTIVLDLNPIPIDTAGLHFENPPHLGDINCLQLAKSLSKIDGAIHIGADMRLHGFACILDGKSIPGEDRARGARFNSALRFTAVQKNVTVIVVSSDRPVSIIHDGVELNAQCILKPVSARLPHPPELSQWIEGAL